MWKEKETVGGNEIKTWNVIQNIGVWYHVCVEDTKILWFYLYTRAWLWHKLCAFSKDFKNGFHLWKPKL